ncbi:MAG: GPW/gp25 family protein [Anaerolineae bacterium]
MDVHFPYRFDHRKRTAEAAYADHIRQMIEQVLFTAPGERVNRPDFGSGLLQLIFAGNSDELATTTQFLVQSALERWLGDVIQVEAVQITSEHTTIDILVQYVVRQTQERRVDAFQQEVT